MKITIHKDGYKWDGWGTSLAWWAHYIGTNCDESVKKDLAEKIFGESGLELNIIRYNIGGGSNPDTDNHTRLRPGADVPGYKKHKDDPYNWECDNGQLYFVQNYTEDVIIEAFSNSPPWYMTKNGFVSGSRTLCTSNLKKECVQDFVIYLVDVMEHLMKQKMINIEYISPMNEPSSPLCPENQEGCYWDPIIRRKVIRSLRNEIRKRNLGVKMACCDENNVLQSLSAMTVFCDKVNIHTYRLSQFSKDYHTRDIEDSVVFRKTLGFITKNVTRKSLWVSEWGCGEAPGYHDIRNGLKVGLKIINDIVNLRVNGWVYWQVVENGDGNGGWGLIQLPFKESVTVDEIKTSTQYLVMSHFSKFIKRNYTIIGGEFDENGMSYVHAKNETENTIVIVNNTDKRQPVTIDTKIVSMKMYISNNEKRMEEIETDMNMFMMDPYETRTVVF